MEKQLPELERIASGVMADKDEHPHIFSHSDRFLIIDLKQRKEIIGREYRPNPYGKICREKYTMPKLLGEKISDEEWEIYQKIGEILKDCKYVTGKNFGNYTIKGLQEAGTDYLMTDFQPYEWIDSLIDARYLAGYRD